MHLKHNLYQQKWTKSSTKRGSKSLLDRSFEKAALSIHHINADTQKRKNTAKLEDILRNNIQEKKMPSPATFNPEVQGLKGKGGKAVPLFQEVYLF